MARKRAPPLKDPPSASSSEEEETSSGEEEASDDERSQPSPPQPQSKTIRTQNSTPKKPEPTTHQSESELESESGSDSESEPEPGQSVKPKTSKPMEEIPPKEAAAAVVKKSRSKPAVAATPEKSTAVKRGNGADRDPKDLKRAKNKQSDPEKSEDSKKQLFQRLWTEDDEISLLQGIIDFIAEKGYDPSKDTNAFLDFIKQSLHFDVSMTQLKDKIFRLRKKFENNVKGKKGENKVFSKPHDQKGFDLSKYIWGSEGCIKANGKKNTNFNDNKKGNGKKLEALKADLGIDAGEERMEVEMERDSSVKKVLKFDKKASVGTMEDYVVRCGLDFAHGMKKEEMEEKWRKLHIAEMELCLKRNELLREESKIMLSAFKADKD
ncbi:hypothetical protein DKX38_017560 [Salix brachista]|uniref:Glabrous enhancer-binding protein-like DBD domain-containing protein n=1 Tax=Salix brachista TaxID=2182728 RepID=A0A5N5KVL3_9ROSI|nr:hypothetical protein DKX38_017560 [Salix brachista]